MKKYKYLIMFFLLAFNMTASASLVTIDGAGKVTLATEKNSQTLNGQTFSFDFIGIPQSDGNDGLLSFKVRGDYSQSFSNENINIAIDGMPLGPYSVSSSNLIQSFNEEDNEWEMSVDVLGGFISSWTFDEHIEMIVTLSPDVNLGLAVHTATNGYIFDPYIDVTLKYTTVVPVPMGLWLFVSGLIPLMVMRRS